jgi:hypothetical protein
MVCLAQENSPYSRYGVGNILPQGNLANRGMGGISAGVSDITTVNTVNPAAPASLIYTTLDVGIEYDGLNLKSKSPIGNFKSNYGIVSYLQFAFPLLNGNKKAFKNKTSWSINFGLRPITRINYKIINTGRNAIDSTESLYEGSGGINEGFVGTALKIKNFSIGFTTGYLFGNKDYDTRMSFSNDTVSYYKGNYQTKSTFGGMFLNLGAQYVIKVNDKSLLRLGAYGNLKKDYNASRDDLRETFTYNTDGAPLRVDSVYENNNQKGKVTLPATVGGGFAFENEHLLVGADIEVTNWQDYRYFGQKDFVKNSWTAKGGVQYFPGSATATGYFNFVKYRAGFSYGTDYINIDNNLPVYTISLGAAFPLKLKHSFYDLQYSVMNLSFEYGNRGNKANNLTENQYKIGVGFSLSDVWFRRQKYQ